MIKYKYFMESFGNNKSLTGGEQKIEEYVNRIKNGESKDSIFKDLPESFKSGVEKRIAEAVSQSEEKTSVETSSTEKTSAENSTEGVSSKQMLTGDSDDNFLKE